MEVIGPKCCIALRAFASSIIVTYSDAFKTEYVMAFVKNRILSVYFAAWASQWFLQINLKILRIYSTKLPSKCGFPPVEVRPHFRIFPSSLPFPAFSSGNSCLPPIALFCWHLLHMRMPFSSHSKSVCSAYNSSHPIIKYTQTSLNSVNWMSKRSNLNRRSIANCEYSAAFFRKPSMFWSLILN